MAPPCPCHAARATGQKLTDRYLFRGDAGVDFLRNTHADLRFHQRRVGGIDRSVRVYVGAKI